MKRPFPGMDPYLEGHLWPDVHHELASSIRSLIAPKILPKYVTRLEIYTIEDTEPSEDVGILYPNIEILRDKKQAQLPLKSDASNVSVLTPETITIETEQPISIKIPVVAIRDREENVLITAIEILSPVNKRKPGLKPYRKKRKTLHKAGVHLLEIDLLRRGARPLIHPLIPESAYLVTLTRGDSSKTNVWGIQISELLPVVPVPLKVPDPDIILDLNEALRLTFERGLYHYSIDYQQNPPPPAFSGDETFWLKTQIKNFQKS